MGGGPAGNGGEIRDGIRFVVLVWSFLSLITVPCFLSFASLFLVCFFPSVPSAVKIRLMGFLNGLFGCVVRIHQTGTGGWGILSSSFGSRQFD